MVKARSLGYLLGNIGLFAGLVLAAEGTGPEPTAPTSARRLVVPDEFATVRDALRAANAGETVFLKPGTYHEAIDLKSGVRLLGEGMDKVTLQFDGSKSVITVKDCCDVTICGLTARHMTTSRRNGGNAGMVVDNSTVVIAQCRIAEAAGTGMEIANKANATINSCTIENNGARGIEVKKGSTVVMHACEIAHNPVYGVVLIGGQTSGTVRDCRISGSKFAGLAFWFGATGTAQGNDVQSNDVGIEVGSQLDVVPGIEPQGTGEGPVLLKNRCHGNKSAGIQIQTSIQARAEQNLCEENAGSGIVVCRKGAPAALDRNRCLNNGKHGILVYGEGTAALIGNECAENHSDGIYINQTRREIKVEGNSCRANQGAGITIYDTGGAVIANNTCQSNLRYGIYVRKTTSLVTVSKNRCMGNHNDGIAFAGETQGAIDNNICSENDQCGLIFGSGTRSLAEANVCQSNRCPGIWVEDPNTVVTLRKNFSCGNNDSGILFLNVADSTAEGNVCLENLWSGIAVRGANARPTLSANQCNNNGAWGIIAWGGADPNVSADNETLDNWKGGIKRRLPTPAESATAKQI
jgi:parallel beta-helix repeat protein